MVNDPNMIVLNSMHKYQPRILIVPAESMERIAYAPTYSAYVFPSTEFVAVTAYQNQRVTKLKIAHNPFAKGFRERNSNQAGNRKRKPRDIEVSNLRAQLEMDRITLPNLPNLSNLRNQPPPMSENYKRQRLTPSPGGDPQVTYQVPPQVDNQPEASNVHHYQMIQTNKLTSSPSSQSNSSFSSTELSLTPSYSSPFLSTSAQADDQTHLQFNQHRPQPNYVSEYNLQYNFEPEVQGDFIGMINHEPNPLSFALFN